MQRSYQQNLKSINQKSNDIPPPLPKSPPPLEAPQRLDRLVASSSYANEQNPTERKVTFEMPTKYSSSLKNGENFSNENGHHSSPKKVSFNDNPTSLITINNNEIMQSDVSNGGFTLEDIDEVLGTSTSNSSWLSNSYVSTHGNTPGVIGAQEVYNDPRQRIEAERLKLTQNQKPNHLGPEKLSFKEKRKMFAMETGQIDTPKDKVKSSKAEREILEGNFEAGLKSKENNNNTISNNEQSAQLN